MTPRHAWLEPHTNTQLTEAEALARMSQARIVLLGERHDRAEDHLWQADTLAGLVALRSPVIVGFEMFPRSAQPALDAWAGHHISFEAFLDQTRWQEVWGFDPALYRPIFDLCRAHRLSLRGLNISRPLVTEIGRDGWQAVPSEDRDWFTPARPAGPAYRHYLFEITGGVRPGRAAQGPDDPAFDRFVRAQQSWDRAFACTLAEAAFATPDALVVALIGRGHLEYGFGVADQLDDLGLSNVMTALPDAPKDAGQIADMVHLGGAPDGRETPWHG